MKTSCIVKQELSKYIQYQKYKVEYHISSIFSVSANISSSYDCRGRSTLFGGAPGSVECLDGTPVSLVWKELK